MLKQNRTQEHEGSGHVHTLLGKITSICSHMAITDTEICMTVCDSTLPALAQWHCVSLQVCSEQACQLLCVSHVRVTQGFPPNLPRDICLLSGKREHGLTLPTLCHSHLRKTHTQEAAPGVAGMAPMAVKWLRR